MNELASAVTVQRAKSRPSSHNSFPRVVDGAQLIIASGRQRSSSIRYPLIRRLRRSVWGDERDHLFRVWLDNLAYDFVVNLHRVFLAVTNQSLGNFVVSPISKRVDCWQTRRVGEDYSIYSTVYPRAPSRRSTQAASQPWPSYLKETLPLVR